MNNDQLMRMAPSIFAEHAHHSRSGKYVYIPTLDLINSMRSEGFNPVQVSMAKNRDQDKKGFGKHLIRFRRDNEIDKREVRELVLINSHDGSSGFRLMAGMYRFVCANGLICGQTDSEIRVRHSGTAINEVIEGSYRILDDFDQVSASVDAMRSTMLSDEHKLAFGRAALAIKYEDSENCGFEPKQIIRPRRVDDQKNDLWSVFNATQENMLKGGQYGMKTNEFGRRVSTHARAIKGIDQNVALNRGLWTLAEEMKRILN